MTLSFSLSFSLSLPVLCCRICSVCFESEEGAVPDTVWNGKMHGGVSAVDIMGCGSCGHIGCGLQWSILFFFFIYILYIYIYIQYITCCQGNTACC